MPKTKIQKQEIVRDLTHKLAKAKSVVFAQFGGLTVKENEALRKELKKENSEYCVAKKTLLDLSFKDLKLDALSVKGMEGRIAAIFGYEDEVAPAKILNKFKKSLKDKIEFAGGILENKFLNQAEVTALAELPTKQELYAKIVGSMNAPISGFVNVMAGNLRGLVTVLNAVKDKKNV